MSNLFDGSLPDIVTGTVLAIVLGAGTAFTGIIHKFFKNKDKCIQDLAQKVQELEIQVQELQDLIIKMDEKANTTLKIFTIMIKKTHPDELDELNELLDLVNPKKSTH